jgi:hypothetical protein
MEMGLGGEASSGGRGKGGGEVIGTGLTFFWEKKE